MSAYGTEQNPNFLSCVLQKNAKQRRRLADIMPTVNKTYNRYKFLNVMIHNFCTDDTQKLNSETVHTDCRLGFFNIIVSGFLLRIPIFGYRQSVTEPWRLYLDMGTSHSWYHSTTQTIMFRFYVLPSGIISVYLLVSDAGRNMFQRSHVSMECFVLSSNQEYLLWPDESRKHPCWLWTLIPRWHSYFTNTVPLATFNRIQ